MRRATAHAIVLLTAVLGLPACAPETDRGQYPAGDPGQVAFRNTTGMTLWLAGCSHFDYEQRVGDAWVAREPEQICVWEGFAEPVAPGAVVTDRLDTRRASGTWRVRYPVGVECRADAPLAEANCAELLELASNTFEIRDEGCAIGGCSGQLCGEADFIRSIGTTCEWRDQYACYRKARCGRFGPGGSCGWEPTPELAACLSDPPEPVW